MRKLRVLAVAIAIALLVVPPVPAAVNVTESVWPLTIAVDGEMQNICTVTSINARQRYWLTAAHCVVGAEPRFIMGDRAVVVALNVHHDVAILQTARVKAPAVPLAQKGPEVLDPVIVTGYPFGFPFQVTTAGTVATLDAVLENTPYVLFNITGAPGNSGSAIVNARGEVISLVQIGWSRSFSPMMGGVPFEVLAEVRRFWEE